jgi:hypothetical protein
VTVADESSKTGGREIIDFVIQFGHFCVKCNDHFIFQAGSTEEGVAKYIRGLKKLIS